MNSAAEDRDIVIRAFRDSDQDGIVGLWCEVFQNEPAWSEPAAVIRRKLTVRPEPFFVAERGERIIGSVLAGYDGVRGSIYNIAVHPSERRQGIARRLVTAAEQALFALGCPNVHLEIRGANFDVVAFCKAIGYEVEERVSMGKRLESA